MDESVLRQKVERFFEYAGADVDRAEELYHEDAVLEFPQSGERFEGRDRFTEWRSQYPVERAEMRYRIRRVTVREDFTVVRCRRVMTAVRPGYMACSCWTGAATRWPASGSTSRTPGKRRSGEHPGARRPLPSEPEPLRAPMHKRGRCTREERDRGAVGK
jgi:SnoaL-like domain